jgi:hypothetical protein
MPRASPSQNAECSLDLPARTYSRRACGLTCLCAARGSLTFGDLIVGTTA